MNLNNLPKTTTREKKRVGRGNGSGKGKTSARGQKGQKVRGSIRGDFEGGQLRLIKRLPFRRGIGNLAAIKSTIVKVEELNNFKTGDVITLEILTKAKIIDSNTNRVKIVGGGDLNVALKVEVPVTKTVRAMIEKAGGSIS